MNSVLNDLTYCDGRFDIDAYATFSDSPSRLKLRSNTYQGIQASLEKRRTPAKANEFIIPSVALPEMKVVEDETPGGMNKETKKDEFTYKNLSELESVQNGASKKLKVGQKQHDGLVSIRDKYMEVLPDNEKKEAIVEEKQTIPTPIVDLPKVDFPKTDSTEEVSKVIDAISPIAIDEVKSEPVKTEETKVEPTVSEEPTSNVKEEVENEMKEEEPVDEFSTLQKATEKYQEVAKEYDKAKQELNNAEDEMKTSKEKLETTEREISEKEDELNNQRNVIDTARKDIASIQEEIEKVREEIKRKTVAIEKAREKKEREKRELENQTKQTKETNNQYQQGIEANNKTLEKLKEESKELANEESKVLNERTSIRSELEELEEILKAITLPEDIEEYTDSVSPSPKQEPEIRPSFIPVVEDKSDVVIDLPTQKSIGSYTRAA